MKITFEANDIFDALKSKLTEAFPVNEDTMEIDIEFKNGRGDNGPTAYLDIVPKGTIAKRRAEEAAKEAAKPAKDKAAPVEKTTDTASADATADTAAPAADGEKKSLFN